MKTNRWGSKATRVCFIPCLLILGLFKPLPIQAQTASLAIWPPLLTATVQPGQAVTQSYRLKNLGDDTTVNISLIPFEAADELGHVSLSFHQPQSPALGYFKLNYLSLPLSLDLKAGETRELPLTITIPQNAPQHDYYLSLLFQAQTQSLLPATGSTIQPILGSNLLLTVSAVNQHPPQLQITQFSLKTPLLDSFEPLGFTIKAFNPSLNFTQAVGHIDIFNSLGRKSATIPLRSDYLLKQSTRQLIAEKPWQPFFPFGRYTATLTLTPKETQNTISQTISFWIIPYKLILGLLLTFLIYRLLITIAKYIKANQHHLPKLLRF